MVLTTSSSKETSPNEMVMQEKFANLKCCVIIPTYNNGGTLQRVIEEVLEYTDDLIVINDGATDNTAAILNAFEDKATILHHKHNQGKGKALRNGFAHAQQKGYVYAITMDSDGQHFAADLPRFLEAIQDEPDSLIIGARNMKQENVPGKSSFGNRFSNFWFWAETGIQLDDTQSGYRLYPIQKMKGIAFITKKFEFEIEVLVKSAWKGIKVWNIPIKVHYEAGKDRISHFRPFHDFGRISVLNTFLVTLALLYYIPLRFFKSLTQKNIENFIKKNFFDRNEPPQKKATAVGFGVFMGIFPVWGYQMIIGVAVAHFLRLNKALVLVAANISIPPMIPLILYGSYRFGAIFMDDPKNDILFHDGLTLANLKDNLVQYLIGALLLATTLGLLSGLLTYIYLKIRRRDRA